MQTYIFLVRFTDQGMRNIKDTIGRDDAFKTMAEKCGAALKTLCWTIGRYDVIAVFEAPDDESTAALSFSVSSLAVSGTRSCAPSLSRRWARSSPRWCEKSGCAAFSRPARHHA